MKKKHFYSHLVNTDSLVEELNKMKLTDSEKAHLLALIDDNLHHTVLDAVLSELSEKDKKKFLVHLYSEDHVQIWEHLNKKVDNIEEKIKKVADDLKEELHEDIREVKKTK